MKKLPSKGAAPLALVLAGRAGLHRGTIAHDLLDRIVVLAPAVATRDRPTVYRQCGGDGLVAETCLTLQAICRDWLAQRPGDGDDAMRDALVHALQPLSRTEPQWRTVTSTFIDGVDAEVRALLHDTIVLYLHMLGYADATPVLVETLWAYARAGGEHAEAYVLRASGVALLDDGSDEEHPDIVPYCDPVDPLAIAEIHARAYLKSTGTAALPARLTHAEEIDDDRAGIARHPPAAPAPKPAKPAPTPEAAAGLSLRVFPSMRHLPQPTALARDRGDSPRALCDSVAEVALPMVPAPDPAVVAATMDAAFPWAREVTEQYTQDLVGAPYAMLKPRTLVGGMGGAKTSYARALLRAVGLPEVLYSAAGVMDGGNFAGASRTWSTWRLSVPAQGVLRFRQASLGVIVDEAEKAGPSRRWGRLDETLLPFLERGTTAKAIFDPAVEAPLDLSAVSYILTANRLDGLSGPLLDRAPPVQWPMPRREDMPVAAAAILDELRRERGLSEAWCPALDGNELDALTAWRGGSLRPLRRMVETVVASREQFARLMPN